MPFGFIGRMGPRIRQVVGFGDQSMERDTFVGEFGAHHCNRRGPFPKLLWADLLLLLLLLMVFDCHRMMFVIS